MAIIATVGELQKFLASLPEETPIGRYTTGYFQVYKLGDTDFTFMVVENLSIKAEKFPALIVTAN
jgi:hypothetical protein